MSVDGAEPPTCGACMFAAKTGADEIECRRHPPTGSVVAIPAIVNNKRNASEQGWQIKQFTGFPRVISTAWCGDFSRRVAVREAEEAEPIPQRAGAGGG